MSNKNTQAAASPDIELVMQRLAEMDERQAKQLRALHDELTATAARLEVMSAQFGEALAISAPRVTREPVPLTVAEIKAILAARPSASFRLLQDCTHVLCPRKRGAILRPQTMQPQVWQALLDSQVRLEDADTHM